MHSLHKRSRIVCTVGEKDGKPEFVVTVEEPGHQNVVFKDATTKGALLPVLNGIGEGHEWMWDTEYVVFEILSQDHIMIPMITYC